MNSEEEILRIELGISRRRLKVLQTLKLPRVWGRELERYARLLGQLRPHWFEETKRESQGK